MSDFGAIAPPGSSDDDFYLRTPKISSALPSGGNRYTTRGRLNDNADMLRGTATVRTDTIEI